VTPELKKIEAQAEEPADPARPAAADPLDA